MIRRRNDPASRDRRLERRARRAARELRELAERFRREAEAHPDDTIRTEWEAEFMRSVPDRVDEYGRAFRDPSLTPAGDRTAPLSFRQHAKVGELRRLLARRTARARDRSRGQC